MLTTQDPQLAEKLKKLRVHGAKKKYYHEEVGGNFRLHEMQAAFLRAKLPQLEGWLKRRVRNAENYLGLFSASLGARPGQTECVCEAASRDDEEKGATMVLPFRCHASHTFNQFVVRIPGVGKRDRLRETLQARNVGTEVYYPRPLHVQECFRDLGYREGDFPWAEKFSRETLALPIYPELELKEIEQVAGEVAKLVRQS